LRSVKIGDTDDISSYIQQVMNICGDFEAVYRLPGMLSTLSPVIPVIAGTPIVATAAEIAAAFTATIRL
jgi:hypothetical protein